MARYVARLGDDGQGGPRAQLGVAAQDVGGDEAGGDFALARGQLLARPGVVPGPLQRVERERPRPQDDSLLDAVLDPRKDGQAQADVGGVARDLAAASRRQGQAARLGEAVGQRVAGRGDGLPQAGKGGDGVFAHGVVQVVQQGGSLRPLLIDGGLLGAARVGGGRQALVDRRSGALQEGADVRVRPRHRPHNRAHDRLPVQAVG